MKEIKAVFRIRLKNYIKKLNAAQAIEQTNKNYQELYQLKESLSTCIKLIKQILDIYSNLINLGEKCELDEDQFLDEIQIIQRLHKTLDLEINKKSNQELYVKYLSNIHFKKDTFNI